MLNIVNIVSSGNVIGEDVEEALEAEDHVVGDSFDNCHKLGLGDEGSGTAAIVMGVASF